MSFNIVHGKPPLLQNNKKHRYLVRVIVTVITSVGHPLRKVSMDAIYFTTKMCALTISKQKLSTIS